jgi:putative ubiquitin-RnfH superfamily antitoxin RatB of RatAB toxin-antitoxin module
MNRFHIEVVCAFPDVQKVVSLQCDPGITLEQAINKSRILDDFPELNLDEVQYGVHGLRQSPDFVLSDNDRVEIYRQLFLSPTEARRLRAESRERKKTT